MDNYALVDRNVARNYNLKVFVTYLRDQGLVYAGDALLNNVVSQNNLNILSSLDYLISDNELKLNNPNVVKIANYIYGAPEKLVTEFPELELIVPKDLSAYGFRLDYIRCPASHSINFNNSSSFDHIVWTNDKTDHLKDSTFGRVLIKYQAPTHFVNSLDELREQETIISTVFERDANSLISGNLNYTYCALCGLTNNAISTVVCKNNVEDITTYLNDWVTNAVTSREEWVVLAALHPPIIS